MRFAKTYRCTGVEHGVAKRDWGSVVEQSSYADSGGIAATLLIFKILTAAKELKNKLFYESLEKEHGSK